MGYILDGMSMERLVLQRPDYIVRMLQGRTGGLLAMREYARQVLQRFDALPLNGNCSRRGCENRATRLYVWVGGDVDMLFSLCDSCAPDHPDKVWIIRNFNDAVTFVEACCRKPRTDLRAVVELMALEKGINPPFTEEVAREWLRGLPAEGADDSDEVWVRVG